MPFNPEPKFLGVYLDRELIFLKHVTEIATKAKSKMGMLFALYAQAQDMGLHENRSDESLHLSHLQHHGLHRSRLANHHNILSLIRSNLDS